MFGKFNSGKSPIHGLDPRAKIYFLLMFIPAALLANRWIPVAIVSVAAFVIIFISEIPFGNIIRSSLLVLALIFLVSLITLPLISWQFAVMLFLKLVSITFVAEVVTMSTRPEDLLAGFMQGFRMPAQSSMTMLRVFTFPTVFGNEMIAIRDGQAARGADVVEGRFFERTGMKLRVMQPRVKAASVRSRKIKTAAELKCYDRDSQRIVTRPLKFAEGDFVFIVLGAVILVACVFTQFFLHLLIS